MKIGYACITNGVPFTEQRTCTMKFASKEKLLEIIEWNLYSLDKIIDYNIANEIKLFRLSSGFIPFGSSSVNELLWWEDFDFLFEKIGKKIKENDIRISTHPGQYTILNSPNIEVVERAKKDLWYHNKILNALGTDNRSKIILHIGGMYGDKTLSIKRFIENFEQIDEDCKKRIVIENDDKLFNIGDCLAIGEFLNIPVVLDILHHEINPPNKKGNENYWLKQCKKTWKDFDGKQKIHYSQQDEKKRAGSHAKDIGIEKFLNFYYQLENKDIDIMLEVKNKNLSANKCINCVFFDNNKEKIELEWRRYKYSVGERANDIFQEIDSMIIEKKFESCIEFYKKIEIVIKKNISKAYSLIVANTIWEQLKENVTTNENKRFFSCFEKYKNGKCGLNPIKNLIKKMAIKYNLFYLLSSYYFVI